MIQLGPRLSQKHFGPPGASRGRPTSSGCQGDPLGFGSAVILTKYGMDGKRDTRSVDSNSLKDHDVKEGDTFDDPRLDKLWNRVCAVHGVGWGGPPGVCLTPPSARQAKSSGKFSAEEMSSLKKEFQHHKDKIHEYNILMDAVSRTEGESTAKITRSVVPATAPPTAPLHQGPRHNEGDAQSARVAGKTCPHGQNKR